MIAPPSLFRATRGYHPIVLSCRKEFSVMKNLFVLLLTCSLGAQAQVRDSLDIKIGQMILIGFPKAEVDSVVLREVRAGKAGTLILFEKNVPKSATAFNALKKIIWTYQKAAPIPLLISIDQEGGNVNRLKEKYGFPRSITASAMGKAKTLDSVRFYAESIASNLAGLGINVNFAPVVDVAVNPNNPVIAKSGRSFSANPDSVTLLAREYIRPHRKFGVLTVLKHFPGHGSSQEDTHYGVADVTRFWRAYELNPYRSLIQSGDVDAVMSAHIVNRNLDKNGYPGTLSSFVIDSLLRKTLGYQGVVFSDDMDMQAISKQYGLEQAIKMAISAGIDILCFAHNLPASEGRAVDRVHAVIRKAVDTGEIPVTRIDQSYRRVMALKARLREDEVSRYRQQAERAMKEAQQLQQQAAANERHAWEAAHAGQQQAEAPTPAEKREKKKKKRKGNDKP